MNTYAMNFFFAASIKPLYFYYISYPHLHNGRELGDEFFGGIPCEVGIAQKSCPFAFYTSNTDMIFVVYITKLF